MSSEEPPREGSDEQEAGWQDPARVRTSVPKVNVRLPRRRKRASEGLGFLYFVLGTAGLAGAIVLWSLGRIIARVL